MEPEGSDGVPDEDPGLLTEEDLQKIWDEWVGDLRKMRDIYVMYLELYQEKEPELDKLRRANKAAARTLLYQILLKGEDNDEQA